jgi:hypothetical protein
MNVHHSNEENIYVAMELAMLVAGLGFIVLVLIGQFGIGF